MWCVELNRGVKPVEAVSVEFDPYAYGQGLPKGEQGEVKQGFCFYALISEEQDGQAVMIEVYLTFALGNEPMLTAVTPKQFKHWQGQTIIAKPCSIIWKVKI